MPRFPVIPQRTSSPAAFANAPRAQAAHFGAGVGRHLADLGAGAAELGQAVEQRQVRQAEGQLAHFDRELARLRLESDAQAPPGETGESRIERHGALFDDSAAAVLKHYEGQSLHSRLSEGIAARRETMMQRLLKRAAEQRLHASLQDTRELVESWSGRIAQDPSVFTEALQELLGDEAEPGLLKGLGLRPEALAAWKTQSLHQLLEARLSSDPEGLLVELASERWREVLPEERLASLRAEAQEVQRHRSSVEAIDVGRQRAGQAQELSADIAAGRAGYSEIRRAEDAGTVSAPQAEALRQEAERAETARQAEQIATDELALVMSGGVGFDAGNPQNRRAADAFYEKTYSPVVREGAPEEVLDQVVSMVAKTGYLPPRLARDTTGLLLGGDAAGQVRGAELYGRLREAAPALVEEAIDLEARARGGTLKRWLDAGLEPGDALARTEADLTDEAAFHRENREAFRQDLGKRLGERLGGVVATELLPRLESKYLTLLGQGISPQKARTLIQQDQARAFMRWSHSESRLADAGFVWGERDGERVLIPTEPRLQKMAAPAVLGGGAALGSVILVATAYSYMIQTARDWGFEVPEVMEDLEVWLNSLSEETRIYVIETAPDIASASNQAVVRLGDGAPHLGRIVKENDLGDKRSVEFFLPGHGRVTLDQQYDVTTGRYDGDEITFYDREQKQWVTEKYATSRFNQPAASFGIPRPSQSETTAPGIIAPEESLTESEQAIVVPSDEQRPFLQPGPPAEPIPIDPLPPSEAGTGLELIPSHTGGNQTGLGPLLEHTPGFPAQEQDPLILVNPDLSDDPRFPSVLFAVNAAKGRFAAHVGRKLKEAFKDIEAQTGIGVSQKQFRLLKKELQKRAFWESLSKDETADLRDEYKKSYDKIILEWQDKTEQEWPTYKREIEENGKMVMREFRYQVHHIIPLKVGGPPTAWWNVHPARFPDQHQGGLHRSDGPLNELTK